MRKIFPIHLIIPFVWILTIASNIEPIFSQTKKIDSLKLAIVRAKEDSVKVNILYNLGREFWKRLDFDNTLKYTDEALKLAH